MWDILRIFLVMGLCFVLLTPVNTLALSMQRLRAFVFAAVVAVIAQLVIVVPLGRTVGAEAVAVAHATIAVGMILLVAVGVFGRRMPAAVGSAVVAALPGIALAVVFPLLALVAPDGWVASIGFSLIGIALYVGLGVLLWPRRRAAGAGRRAAALEERADRRRDLRGPLLGHHVPAAVEQLGARVVAVALEAERERGAERITGALQQPRRHSETRDAHAAGLVQEEVAVQAARGLRPSRLAVARGVLRVHQPRHDVPDDPGPEHGSGERRLVREPRERAQRRRPRRPRMHDARRDERATTAPARRSRRGTRPTRPSRGRAGARARSRGRRGAPPRPRRGAPCGSRRRPACPDQPSPRRSMARKRTSGSSGIDAPPDPPVVREAVQGDDRGAVLAPAVGDVDPHAGRQIVVAVHDAVERGRLHARTLRSLAAMSDDLACWTCGTTAVPDTRFPNLGYVRCPACDLVFAPSSSQERLRELYGEAYFEDYGLEGTYDADADQRRREAQVRVRWLREAGPPIGRLLEIGCASGWFLAEARAVGYEVVGIEPAEEMAAAARERSGAEVHAAMLEDASLAPGSFDVAVAWHVLEHLAQPRDTLAGVRAALRPGGRLLLELPNIASLRATRQGEDWYGMEPAHHVAHYSPRGARRAAARVGLRARRSSRACIPGTLLGGREAFGPRGLAFQAKETLSARAWMRAPHPWKFDLLRAVARVP